MFLSRLKFLQCLRISKAKAIKNKFKADAFKEWKCERFKIPLVNIYGVVGGGGVNSRLLHCCPAVLVPRGQCGAFEMGIEM